MVFQKHSTMAEEKKNVIILYCNLSGSKFSGNDVVNVACVLLNSDFEEINNAQWAVGGMKYPEQQDTGKMQYYDFDETHWEKFWSLQTSLLGWTVSRTKQVALVSKELRKTLDTWLKLSSGETTVVVNDAETFNSLNTLLYSHCRSDSIEKNNNPGLSYQFGADKKHRNVKRSVLDFENFVSTLKQCGVEDQKDDELGAVIFQSPLDQARRVSDSYIVLQHKLAEIKGSK